MNNTKTSLKRRWRNLNSGAIFIATLTLLSCSRSDVSISLADGERNAKLAQIIHAEDIRTVTTETLELTQDSDPLVRKTAYRAIGRIGTDDISIDSAAALLFAGMDDSARDVAAEAAFALGLMGKDSAIANRLVEIAFTAPEEIALAAIFSAGRAGDSASGDLYQKLVILLNNQKPSLRSAAALALFLSGGNEMSDKLIQTALGDTAKSVRDATLYSLVRMRVDNAKDVYLAYVEDTDSYLQALALRGLGLVNDTTLAGVVAEFCSAEDPNLRSQAITTLGALQCDESITALANALNSEQDERLKAQALDALSGFDPQKFRQLAVNEIQADNSLGLDMAIVAALSRALSGSHRDLLLDSLLRNGNPRLYEALFSNLPDSLPERSAMRYRETYAPLASGPGQYMMFDYLQRRDLYQRNWLSTLQLWDSLSANIDPISKGVYLEHAAERREPWFFALALRLISEGYESNSPLNPEEREEIMRSVLSATETMLTDAPGYTPDERAQDEAKQIFEIALKAPNFVISRRAAQILKQRFDMDRAEEIVKPAGRYTVEEIATRLATDPQAAGILSMNFDNKTVTIELDYQIAPLTCFRLVDLAREKFYDPVTFHRVIPNFVTQGGDPRGDGWGGPSESMRCEYSSANYKRGTVGIATSGKDTGGSQFFITLSAQPHLEARYTIIGKVISEMADVDNIRQGDQANTITVGQAPQL